MAEAAAKSVLGMISRGHLECPICSCRFAHPKMLDCLHSFCLNCLDKLISSQQPRADEITCPVCRQGTAVPDTGLQGLPNCFFLSSLVDEFNKQEQLLGDAPANAQTCEECEEGLEAISRCLDCDGNICQKCLDTHRKMKSTKKHRIVNLNQSGAEVFVPRLDLGKKDTLKCNKHTTHELCFYCETCKTLVCAKCAALDHRTAEHDYREVADAIRSYRQDVGKILQRFENSREDFKVADDSLLHARDRLRIMVARACKDITDKEEEEIAKIKNKSRLLRDKVVQIGQERDRKFEEVRKSNRYKMERAEQIVATVNDLMQQAEDLELLDLKPKVMHNLEFQEEVKLEHAQHELSFIGVKCQDVVADTDLGEVIQEEKWQLQAEFGEEGPEDGQFQFAAGVACLSNGDIAVTDIDKKECTLFTSTGKYKTRVGREKLNKPIGIAVTCDDQLLVTDEKYVKVFNSNLEFLRQFAPSHHDTGDTSESRLTVIAVVKNRIAVTDRGRQLVSLHQLDGSLITTVPNDLARAGLAVGINERLIFTNFVESKLICTTRTEDEVFNIHTSLDGQAVTPVSVCCDDAGDIYMSVYYESDESGGVHHYSPDGVFLGRVARGLHSPCGLTFAPSGDLVVADEVSVKIFQRV
ncbi:E3 ubiquitin-protein ligase TRIM71-like [Patiria miniata]|uniref:Uncharacterized protein n=1 Tax=Patiria miniata TaxID=46514 RepID=A0A913ZP52_PATMI|nr:E3 ubiquitin-protein ligase TRIM71-like [Patiria miniata]